MNRHEHGGLHDPRFLCLDDLLAQHHHRAGHHYFGGPALQLLYLRPVSALLGAAIAALVVMFVLPIQVRNRFSAALGEFLQAINSYLQVQD